MTGTIDPSWQSFSVDSVNPHAEISSLRIANGAMSGIVDAQSEQIASLRKENARLLELVNFYRDAFPTDAAMAQRNLGRPRIEDAANSFEATKPWLALGWSRSTWYRRQAEKRKEQAL